MQAAWSTQAGRLAAPSPRPIRRKCPGVLCSASNGSTPNVDTKQPQQAIEMLEMVVADDLRPQRGASPGQPSKRLVPAPHKAAPKVAAQPPPRAVAPAPPAPPKINGSNGKLGAALNGSSSSSGGLNGGLNGNGSAAVAAAGGTLQVPSGNGPPAAVQQLLQRQSLVKAASAELGVAQRQVQEQQLEIKGLRTQLAEKDAEVSSLKQAVAERDVKLKSAKGELLEARMSLQQKDSELKAAYVQLSEAMRDRSAMRTQLAQTHSELAETRAELEQLADDILAIKMLMDEESALGAAPAGATFDGFDSPGGYSVQLAAQAAAEEEDDTLDVLQSLAALSRQLVADAAADDELLQAIQSIEEEQLGQQAQ